MRIRSIKPEFWRDETIVSLPISARLTFVGLWSYVDDNGVGDARVSSIVGDLYSDDMSRDPRETLARVADDLQHLSDSGLVVIYNDPSHPRRSLLFIRNWKRHQKIDRPSKGNEYPTPPAETVEESDSRAILARPSRDPRANSAPGAGEQGNRGTGEQGRTTRPPEPREVTHLPAVRENASVARMQALNQTSVGAAAIDVARGYAAWANNGIDSRTRDEIAREVDPLLNDGIDPHQIADGIKAWHASDSWSPTQIRRFVAKAARTTNNQPTKATQKAMSTMAAAEQIIAELQGEPA